MERIRRAWPVRLLRNAVTGVAALSLVLVLPLAPRGVLRAARRLGAARRAAGDARVIAWLPVHGVIGLGGLAAVLWLLYPVKVIMDLRPAEPSMAVSVTLSLSIVAIVLLSLAVGYLSVRAEAHLTKLLLNADTSLAERVKELTASRAAAVDAQAAELRRIERDLHDGAQARLISMRMNLGLARSSTDPAQTRELIEEAWRSAGQALVDLRDLVRGIHPPVLADRGLTGAIQAAALLCPVPVTLDLDLPGRPDAPVESALYFAAAEALSNVTKHSQAGSAWIRLRHENGRLRLTVGDDGNGGADLGAGTGLAGIRRRLSAFDGTLAVHSPPGGPSELTMELPCALSSQKI